MRLRVFFRLLRHPLTPGNHWILPVGVRRRMNGFMRKRGDRASDA